MEKAVSPRRRASGTVRVQAAAALRNELFRRRNAISTSAQAQASEAIMRHALRSGFFAAPMRVGLYLRNGSEVDPTLLAKTLLARGVAVYLPACIDAQQMEFRRYCGQELRMRDFHSLAVPNADVELAEVNSLDVIVMPLVGFGAAGERIGSGAGFYDRALQNVRKHVKPWRVGVAFAIQQADFTAQTWDVPLHAVLTEAGLTVFV
jgi:5-formyltetrahydrofolate cyclo-ligase